MKNQTILSETGEEKSLPLEAKPLLTLKEASVYTGIGINKLREMSNESSCDYVLFVGRKRMFKREALLQFLKEAYSV
jgi:excisionase family DNA binding protein